MQKPNLPTYGMADAGWGLGSKGKHPEKKRPSKAVLLSFASQVTRVISVPRLSSQPTGSVSMINGCFILLSSGVIYSAIVTETVSKHPLT